MTMTHMTVLNKKEDQRQYALSRVELLLRGKEIKNEYILSLSHHFLREGV